MGTDNLFHKKKKRKAESLRRRRAMKASYDVILIVCEGAKTEPNYFTEVKFSLFLQFPVSSFGCCCILHIPPNRLMFLPVILSVPSLSKN